NVGSFALPPVAGKNVTTSGTIVVDPTAVPSPSLPGITRSTTYRGPGTNNFDMTLAKNIPITERVKFQLRCEAYNVFNHVSFNAVQNTATFNADTGAIDLNKTAFGAFIGDRGARQLQLVGR